MDNNRGSHLFRRLITCLTPASSTATSGDTGTGTDIGTNIGAGGRGRATTDAKTPRESAHEAEDVAGQALEAGDGNGGCGLGHGGEEEDEEEGGE